MTIHEIIGRLKGAKARGAGWLALCPAHSDRNPSLSVREENGKVLIHCHAGCAPEAVMGVLGLQVSDLFQGDRGQNQILATYSYTNESNQLLFQVVRYMPKAFRQRRPNRSGGWIWKTGDVRRVLYRLPEVVRASEIFILEGEKDVETARTLGLVATCNPGGAGKWREDYAETLRGKNVIIIPDADEPGRKHAQQIATSILKRASSVKLLELPGAKDLTEWIEKGGNADKLRELVQQSSGVAHPASQETQSPRLHVVSLGELLALDVKPREMLLHPFLPTQGLAMLYSKRGVGKTYISLGISVAVASGGNFLAWNAPRARRVLYVDGEMPCSSLQERLASIIAGLVAVPDSENLRIVTPDLQDCGLPDLASPSGQARIEEHLGDVSLLVIDNLSALVRAGKENEGEGWLPVQDWALGLRRRGIGVLFDHHAGKSGAQRGTSRREDLLDSVITLKHPSDYSASEGLRCEVHYEKTRGFLGDDAKPFEVRMQLNERLEAIWTVSDLEIGVEKRVADMLALGMTVREIGKELGMSKSKVQRLKQTMGFPPSAQRSSRQKEGEVN